jgi:hypothetical protein
MDVTTRTAGISRPFVFLRESRAAVIVGPTNSFDRLTPPSPPQGIGCNANAMRAGHRYWKSKMPQVHGIA